MRIKKRGLACSVGYSQLPATSHYKIAAPRPCFYLELYKNSPKGAPSWGCGIGPFATSSTPSDTWPSIYQSQTGNKPRKPALRTLDIILTIDGINVNVMDEIGSTLLLTIASIHYMESGKGSVPILRKLL
jgi:hypothetical protein